jgi:hypothetical protein
MAIASIRIENISGVGNVAPGIVSIEDCGFIFQQGFLGGYSTTIPDIDIEAGWLGQLHIERAYRKHRMPGLTAAMCLKTGVVTSDPVFNAYSHMASKESDYIQGALRITDTLGLLPFTPAVLSSASIGTEYAAWEGAAGTYFYRAQYLYDTVRRVGAAGTAEVSATTTVGGGGVVLLVEAGYRTMIRLFRGTSTGTYTHYVDVPLIAGIRITDNGNDVIGFPWVARGAGGADAVNPGSISQYNIAPADADMTNTAAYGNVVVYARSSMTIPTLGAWRAGDMMLYRTPLGAPNRRLLGYRRMTSGSSHVLGTDWEEVFEEKAPMSANSSELLAIGSVYNANAAVKRIGTMVFDVTLGTPLWASGNLAASTWVNASGAVVHQPV